MPKNWLTLNTIHYRQKKHGSMALVLYGAFWESVTQILKAKYYHSRAGNWIFLTHLPELSIRKLERRFGYQNPGEPATSPCAIPSKPESYRAFRRTPRACGHHRLQLQLG